MYPYLFWIGSFGVPTYGVVAVITLAVCVLVIRHYAVKEGLDPGRTTDAIVLSCAVGLLGARVLHVIVSWRVILDDPSYAWTLVQSNGVFLGAVLTAIPFGLWWFRRRGIPILVGLDLLALVGAMSMVVARWGCFFSGCCWGRPTDVPWGVTFPDIAHRLHDGMPDGPLHPTQIYQSLNSLAIFVILALAYRRKRFNGRIVCLYLMLYAVSRFMIEFYRGDDERGFVFGGLMSTSQLISIVLLMAGLAAYLWLARRHRESGEPDWQPAAAPTDRSADVDGAAAGAE